MTYSRCVTSMSGRERPELAAELAAKVARRAQNLKQNQWLTASHSLIDRERKRCSAWAGGYNRGLKRIRPIALRKGPAC